MCEKLNEKEKTYWELMYDGYYVTIQHCEACGAYLGVNYPSLFCTDCTPSPEYLAAQKAIDDAKGHSES